MFYYSSKLLLLLSLNDYFYWLLIDVLRYCTSVNFCLLVCYVWCSIHRVKIVFILCKHLSKSTVVPHINLYILNLLKLVFFFAMFTPFGCVTNFQVNVLFIDVNRLYKNLVQYSGIVQYLSSEQIPTLICLNVTKFEVLCTDTYPICQIIIFCILSTLCKM